MRKFFLMLCALTVIFFAVAGAADAGSDFYTVITERDGSTHTEDGIAEAGNGAAGYEIWYRGEKLLTVTQNSIDDDGISLFGTETVRNGYYSIEFAVSETDSAFIAGLSRSNKDDVQGAVINAAYTQKKIDILSLDFIDAEKVQLSGNGDDLLCWAATDSNTLFYTGWGKKAGFESEDDLLETFRDCFTDRGGDIFFGYTWFFDGFYEFLDVEDTAQIKEYGKSGNFMPEYSSSKLARGIWDYTIDIRDATDALRNGYGTGIGIAWITNGVRSGGHALTFWGYIYDNRYETETDNDRIKAVIISDSDSDRVSDERRMAPNKLHICNVERYTSYGFDSWRLNTYENGDGVIDSLYMLKPYSDDLEKETDPDATLNAVTTPNFVVDDVYFQSNMVYSTVFADDDVISVIPVIKNRSGADFSGDIEYSVEINSHTYRTSFYTDSKRYSVLNIANPVRLSNLPAGEYDLKITVNPGKTASEAYYYDNTYSCRITVVDDRPDVCDAKMTAVISEQNRDKLNVSFEYENTDGIFSYVGEDCGSAVFASFYIDGCWTDWQYIAGDDDYGAAFPGECTIPTEGTGVKFMAAAFSDRKPAVAVYSDCYTLNYAKLSVSKAEENTNVYSRLPENASSLAAGEKLAFTVENISTCDTGTIYANAALLAYNVNTDELTALYEAENVPLGYGEAPFKAEISSWPAELGLSGTYEISAGVQSEYGEAYVRLGTIEVRERASTVVDTDRDVCDEYDGMTSLREAVSVCGEDDTITVAGLNMINTDSTIIIDKPVRIDLVNDVPDGIFENPYGVGFGTSVYASNKCRIFKVTEGGYLDLRHAALLYGSAKENGGAVLIDGGDAALTGCRVFACKSNRAGGGIYVNNGKLTLKNCCFKRNESSYGSAVAASDSGSIDMLNCTFFLNSSNTGAVYTSGALSAISSTFVDNTAKEAGKSAVTATSIADVTLVNCIAVDDDALSGNVKVYGCILGATEYSGEPHGSKQGVTKEELFKTGENGETVFTTIGTWECLYYIPHLSKTAEMPSSVVSIKGIVALSDGEDTVMTGIASAFSDEELSRDALGNENAGFCGSMKTRIEKTELVLSDSGVTVYTYEGGDAALIGAHYDGAGSMVDMEILSDTIGNGTDFIPADTEGNCKFMLWDSLGSMRSIAPSVRNIE